MLKKIPEIVKLQLDKKLPAPGKTGIDWFLYCYFLLQLKDKKFLELGVGDGGSLISMLGYSNDVTAIDNWNFKWDRKPVEDILTKINRNVTFINEDTLNLNVNNFDSFDFVHLDANKGFHETLHDLSFASKICNRVICIDDYMNSMWPEVTWALDKFLLLNPTWRILIIGNHQAFITNTNFKINELIINLPIVIRNNIVYLTYGSLPIEIKPFCDAAELMYSWHPIAWK